MSALAEMLGVESDALVASGEVHIRHALSRMAAELEDATWLLTESPNIPRSVDALARSHASAFDSLTGSLQSGRITQSAFDKRAHDLISKNFEKAYGLGRGRVLDAGDREWLKRATSTELGYARNFGGGIVGDKLKMARSARAQMYGAAIKGAWWNAKVEAQPDDVRIRWRMNSAVENCSDCQLLAAQSPFTKFNLPTTPQSGSTACRGNCKCFLEFVGGRVSSKEKQDAQKYGQRKRDSIADMMSSSSVPRGMRIPTSLERERIDDLRARINYNRRRIAQHGIGKQAMKDAIRARKLANAELIDFVERESIWEVPLWSVDDVINGRHIGLGAEQEIFSSGVDGATLDLVSDKQFAKIMADYEASIIELNPGKIRIEAEKEKRNASVFFSPGVGEYQLVADGLKDTFLLTAKLLQAARGKDVQVGPLSRGDDVLARMYPWIRGVEEDVDTVLKAIKGISYVAVPVQLRKKGQ